MNFEDALPQLYDRAGFTPALPVNANGELAQPLVRTRLEAEEPDAGDISIRLARMTDDWDFIEELQKPIRRQVGWWTPKTVEGYIAKDGVLVAERSSGDKLGFILFADTYRRQENLGVIYHVNVKPMKQRKLIGARLVKEAFARLPYGVRLFCCWCAQDMKANYFWESLGFVPLAFRAGSRDRKNPEKDARIHIFWQRRIREGDAGPAATPYWYPFNTTGGQLSEQRLVLPIPPGTRWQDAKPVVLPEVPETSEVTELPKVPGAGGRNSELRYQNSEVRNQKSEVEEEELTSDLRPLTSVSSRPGTLAELRAMEAKLREEQTKPRPARKKKKKSRKKAKPIKGKHSREHVQCSRELRDRYLEAMNVHAAELPPGACGKWDVSAQALQAGEAETRANDIDTGRENVRVLHSEHGCEVVGRPGCEPAARRFLDAA